MDWWVVPVSCACPWIVRHFRFLLPPNNNKEWKLNTTQVPSQFQRPWQMWEAHVIIMIIFISKKKYCRSFNFFLYFSILNESWTVHKVVQAHGKVVGGAHVHTLNANKVQSFELQPMHFHFQLRPTQSCQTVDLSIWSCQRAVVVADLGPHSLWFWLELVITSIRTFTSVIMSAADRNGCPSNGKVTVNNATVQFVCQGWYLCSFNRVCLSLCRTVGETSCNTFSFSRQEQASWVCECMSVVFLLTVCANVLGLWHSETTIHSYRRTHRPKT